MENTREEKPQRKKRRERGWRKEEVYNRGLDGVGDDEEVHSEETVKLVTVEVPEKVWPIAIYHFKTIQENARPPTLNPNQTKPSITNQNNDYYCREVDRSPGQEDPDLQEERARESGSSGRRMPKDGLPGKVLALTFVPGGAVGGSVTGADALGSL